MQVVQTFVMPRKKLEDHQKPVPRKRRKSLPDMTSAHLPHLGKLAARQLEPNYDPTREQGSPIQESFVPKPQYGTITRENARAAWSAIFGSQSPAHQLG